jgi:hypothetical protein
VLLHDSSKFRAFAFKPIQECVEYSSGELEALVTPATIMNMFGWTEVLGCFVEVSDYVIQGKGKGLEVACVSIKHLEAFFLEVLFEFRVKRIQVIPDMEVGWPRTSL